MVRNVLPVAALLALGVGNILAQTKPPPPPTPPRPVDPAVRPAPGTAPATEGSTQAYRVKQVLGTKVSLKDNLSIGTVDDVVFNDAGQVEYLIVANEGKLVTVPWEAAKFNFEKQTATVNITQEQYKVIPTYTVREYPVFFEPTYRTQAYRWYGLTPRPFRR
jgi:sporulation protein YlmC with PRC-barrel domain